MHRMVYKDVRLIYDVFQNFLVCSSHAVELLAGGISSVEAGIVQEVITEANHNINEAKNEIINLRSGYPNLMKEVDEQHCEYYVLRQFTQHYHKLAGLGQIDLKHEAMI